MGLKTMPAQGVHGSVWRRITLVAMAMIVVMMASSVAPAFAAQPATA